MKTISAGSAVSQVLLVTAALVVLLAGAVRPARSAPPVSVPAARGNGPKVTVVYRAHFNHAVGAEWSVRKQSTSPKGNVQFLGEFGKEKVSLALDKLPAHAYLRVSLDVLLIRSWDGNHAEWGPDTWQLDLEGGPVILRTNFGYSGVEATQAYPDESGHGAHPMKTGAASANTLGYAYGKPATPADSLYKLSLAIPHRANSARLNFSATGNIVNLAEESWGLDNVTVEVWSGPKAPGAKRLVELWKQMEDPDPVKAVQAKWTLIAAGTPAAKLLRERLSREDKSPGLTRIRELIAQLEDDRWRVRDRAMQQLIAIGQAVHLPLTTAVEKTGSAELKLRARQIFAELGMGGLPADKLRRARATRALALLTWQAAPKTQPAPRPRQPAKK